MESNQIYALSGRKRLKIVRIMKLFSIFMFVFILGANATSYSQKQEVSLNMKQCKLSSLFLEIWKQTGLRFIYNEMDLKEVKPLDVHVEKERVENVLSDVLKNTPYQAFFESDVIYIKARVDTVTQKKKMITLKGTVTDQSGVPLPGVTVFLGNSNIGTATDINGNYTLSVVKGDKVSVTYSFIGMKTVVYTFDAVKDVVHNVTLVEDAVSLNDVVVIGYGAKSKGDLTSSVSSISAKDMEKFNNGTATFDNILGGAIKGVLVRQSSGKPGAAATINVRGITSPVSGSTNEPLYVIDGVPFFAEKSQHGLNPLLAISPNDIKSIDVLKDAAATAIYGSRGANGVIIVNTINGQRNQKMKVSAGYTLSVGNPVKKYKPLNRIEYIDYQDRIIRGTLDAVNRGQVFAEDLIGVPGFMPQEIAEMYGLPYVDLGIRQEMDGDWNISFKYDKINEDFFGKANTNWVDETQNKNALTHQYSVGIRGGSETTNYSFSFNATDQDGTFINEKMERYGARLAFDSDISKRIKAGASLNYSYSKRKLGTGTMSSTKDWLFQPDIPVKNEDGTWAAADGTLSYGLPIALANPVAARHQRNENKSSQFIGSSYLEYSVIDNLKVRGDVNISVFDDHGSLFTPSYSILDQNTFMGLDPLNMGGESSSQLTNTSISFQANYDLDINEHHADFMVGYAWDRVFSEYNSFSLFYFPDDEVLTNVSSAGECPEYAGGKGKSGLNSVFARASYNYDGRYLAEVNFRSDVSSKFGPGNKRVYFPALSLGWRMNREKFMESASFVDDLKLRFSVGQTGSTNVDDFTYRQFFTRSSDVLYEGKPGIVPSETFPNNNVKWEMTTEYNGGVDFSFFNYRLFGSVDAYYRFTKGALSPSPLPFETGAMTFYSNLIDMSNRGMEFELGGQIIQNDQVTWTSKLNIAFNRNRVEKFNNANLNEFQTKAYVEGKPAGILQGYVVEKIFETDKEVAELNRRAQELNPDVEYYQEISTGAGDYKYKDLNNDGVINSEDQAIIGTPEPKFFGGFMNTVSYKGFNLSVVFQFSQGTESLLDELPRSGTGYLGNSLYREMYEKMWTPENKNAKYARVVYADPSKNSRISDKFVFNTSYLRLKNVSLSYTLPRRMLNSLNIESLMFFASVSNIWTLTKWPGLDPESLDTSRGLAGYTTNDDPYPLSKTFSVGVKLEF